MSYRIISKLMSDCDSIAIEVIVDLVRVADQVEIKPVNAVMELPEVFLRKSRGKDAVTAIVGRFVPCAGVYVFDLHECTPRLYVISENETKDNG